MGEKSVVSTVKNFSANLIRNFYALFLPLFYSFISVFFSFFHSLNIPKSRWKVNFIKLKGEREGKIGSDRDDF